MPLLKRISRLIDPMGLLPRHRRPLDIQLTQADIEAELNYPQPDARPAPFLRVTFLEITPEH